MTHYPTMKWLLVFGIATAMPGLAYAVGSPFATGATGLQADILTILQPIAVIAVMVIGAFAWANKISGTWLVVALVGMVLVFGAPQIVSWIRGMFGI
jgi:type IV secretion system protein VirB2